MKIFAYEVHPDESEFFDRIHEVLPAELFRSGSVLNENTIRLCEGCV